MSSVKHSTRLETIKQDILNSVKLPEGNKQELQLRLNELVEETKKEILIQPKILANPAVIGLAGFGISTTLLQWHNLGWMGINPILWVGIVLGGIIQMIAGLMEFATGNNFGFCAFTTYGGFWISFVFIALDERREISEQDKALFLAIFTIFTFIMLVAATRQHLALTIVFFLLFLGLLLMVFSHIYDENIGVKKAGASFLLLAAFGALYIMAHILYLDAFKFDVLPVGPPIQDLKKCMARRRSASRDA